MRKQAKGSILFGSFVGAVDWLALLPLSGRLGRWLDYKPSYWQTRINGQRDRCRFFKVIFVERPDELPEMLNC